MTRYDRILGCLAGLALGDSLGSPTEFLTPQQIRDEFGWVDQMVQAPEWHPHGLLPLGHITDDTGQTLAVVEALDGNGMLTPACVADSLLQWAERNAAILPLIVGPSTRTALTRLQAGDPPEDAGRDGFSNGACYRAVIPGLLHDVRLPELLMSQVVAVCRVTHGTSVAISGAAAVAFAVGTALQPNASLDDITSAACRGAALGRDSGIWRWGTPLEGRIHLAREISLSASGPMEALDRLYRQVGVDMMVPESIAASFGIIHLAEGDPMRAVEYGANIGGDTDTIGAIAGAICGAWRGFAAIDRELLAAVELVNHLDLAETACRLEGLAAKMGSWHD